MALTFRNWRKFMGPEFFNSVERGGKADPTAQEQGCVAQKVEPAARAVDGSPRREPGEEAIVESEPRSGERTFCVCTPWEAILTPAARAEVAIGRCTPGSRLRLPSATRFAGSFSRRQKVIDIGRARPQDSRSRRERDQRYTVSHVLRRACPNRPERGRRCRTRRCRR
jgi:hypothetical protein